MEMQNRYMIYAKVLVTLCGVYLFIIYLPYLLIKIYSSIEQLNADELMPLFIRRPLVSVFTLFGLILYLLTVFLQVKKGLGTPIPLLPPQKLLVGAPYSYCRNPMVLGVIIYYSGICAFIGSWDAFYIVAPAALLLLAYAKFYEEGELESRFGQAYVEYKKQTPFLIPRILGRSWYFFFLH